jgi:hypothetical protein
VRVAKDNNRLSKKQDVTHVEIDKGCETKERQQKTCVIDRDQQTEYKNMLMDNHKVAE